MMKHEFEQLAGYEVSTEDYDKVIEPMYMAVNLSKQDFVKCVDRKRFALPTKRQCVNQMVKIAKHLAETCERYTDYPARDELDNLAKAYAKRFYSVDWVNDTSTYVHFIDEYAYPELRRGCTYPKTLVIGRITNNHDFEYERLDLVR